MAEKIILLFPSECVQTFYVPLVKKKDFFINVSEISKEKLIDNYGYILTIIRTLRKVVEIPDDIINVDRQIKNTGNPALESK